ncbi:MAG: HTTM domain-containing protein, partial [Yaniella sp.]|nr:HTTM domain-containing protein [Yaniella sp.]
SNFPFRHVLWGVASSWAAPFREESRFDPLVRIFSDSNPGLFTFQYLLLMAVAVAVTVGWRTRLTTALLAVGLPALVERTNLLGDQGDNIIRIGLILMVFMTTNAHWSLDSRRRARGLEREVKTVGKRLWFGLPVLPSWLTSLLHNAALIALACQLFILYTASALFKVQGDLWQEGTALYYPLALHEYAVFPGLNELMYANATFLTLATYFSVYIQLFFAVGLIHPFTRRIALIGMILMHGGIAVLMGLPWFSIAMLAFDAIFVSSRTWRWLEANIRAFRVQVRQRLASGEKSEGRRESMTGP